MTLRISSATLESVIMLLLRFVLDSTAGVDVISFRLLQRFYECIEFGVGPFSPKSADFTEKPCDESENF